MATTKTIQPTGTTITMPAMSDRPDASVFATDVDRITDAVNALNSKIGNVPFNLTFNENVITDLSVRFSNCFYCPATKIVHLSFGILSPSGKIPGSGDANAIATVPNEYRPTAQNIQTMGIISNTSNVWSVDKYEALFVNTDGTLKFGNWLGTGTIKVLYVNIDYRIG